MTTPRHSRQRDLNQELEAILIGHWLTDFANFSAFVFAHLPDLNWTGFYLATQDKLILGPFCGQVACTEIAFEKGVCGKAFTDQQSLRVADVHEFPGHISCDPVSRSEMVISLPAHLGVFDLDSPHLNRFSEDDQILLQKWVQILFQKIPAQQFSSRPWQTH